MFIQAVFLRSSEVELVNLQLKLSESVDLSVFIRKLKSSLKNLGDKQNTDDKRMGKSFYS